MLLYRAGDDMNDLFQHVGAAETKDTYNEAHTKVRTGLQNRTNTVVQRNLLFANFRQGTKSKEINNAAKLIDFTDYDQKQAAVDAMILQMSSPRLRETALQENVKYDELIKLGIAKEQSQKGATMLAKASGQDPLLETRCSEEVRRLKLENERHRAHIPGKFIGRCRKPGCDVGYIVLPWVSNARVV